MRLLALVALLQTGMTDFLPFDILQLMKSLPFHMPEVWKRCPFRAEPPRIGHYRVTPGNSLWSPPFLGSRIECLRHKLALKNRTRVLMFQILGNFLFILRWSELPLGNALRRWLVKAGTHKDLSVRKILFDWWILVRMAGVTSILMTCVETLTVTFASEATYAGQG